MEFRLRHSIWKGTSPTAPLTCSLTHSCSTISLLQFPSLFDRYIYHSLTHSLVHSAKTRHNTNTHTQAQSSALSLSLTPSLIRSRTHSLTHSLRPVRNSKHIHMTRLSQMALLATSVLYLITTSSCSSSSSCSNWLHEPADKTRITLQNFLQHINIDCFLGNR
jgi:hypothetical protein